MIIFVGVMDLHIIFRIILWYRLGHWFTLVRQPLVIRVTGIGLACLFPLPDPLHQLLGGVDEDFSTVGTLLGEFIVVVTVDHILLIITALLRRLPHLLGLLSIVPLLLELPAELVISSVVHPC